MRRCLFALLLVALAVPSAAFAVTHDPPELLDDKIEAVKRRTGLRVLVPSHLTTPHPRLYPGVFINRQTYALDLGAARNCRQATACFVAAFLGEKSSQRARGPRRVKLAKGHIGRFTPTRCGASCAAPQVQWRERGVLYTVQAKVGTRTTERRRLVALANSAIRFGPR